MQSSEDCKISIIKWSSFRKKGSWEFIDLGLTPNGPQRHACVPIFANMSSGGFPAGVLAKIYGTQDRI